MPASCRARSMLNSYTLAAVNRTKGSSPPCSAILRSVTGESDMGIADEKMPAPAVAAGGALLLGPALAEKKVEADPGLIAGDCVLNGPRDGDGVSRLTRGAKLGASSIRPVLVAGLEKLPPFA